MSPHANTIDSTARVTIACKQCGADFVTYRSHVGGVTNRGTYCSRSCRDAASRGKASPRRKSVECQCIRCGKAFTRAPSQIADGRGKYCSLSCMAKVRVGPRHASWRGGKATVTCAWCGREVSMHPNKAATRRFCSKDCEVASVRSAMRREQRTCARCGKTFACLPSEVAKGNGKFCSAACRNEGHGRMSLTCANCGKAFLRYPSQIGQRGGGQFCSRSCRAQSRIGDKNAAWNGGGSSIRPSTHAWRAAVFERDGYCCQRCGQVGIDIQAHHVRPVARHPELANDIENGVTLCAPCHRWVHNPRSNTRSAWLLSL